MLWEVFLMPSIDYHEVYSRFFTKVQAYDFIYDKVDDETIEQFLCSWLHSSIAQPFVRRLFSTVKLDDDTSAINFEMKYSVDEDSDVEFVEQILADEMIVGWIKPKIHSINTVVQHFSNSEAKFYSQAQHLQQLISLYSSLRAEVKSLIADRSSTNNIYLDGTSAASSLSS